MSPSPSAQRRASVLDLHPVTMDRPASSWWSRTLAVRALPARAFVAAGTMRGPARGGKPGGWRPRPSRPRAEGAATPKPPPGTAFPLALLVSLSVVTP